MHGQKLICQTEERKHHPIEDLGSTGPQEEGKIQENPELNKEIDFSSMRKKTMRVYKTTMGFLEDHGIIEKLQQDQKIFIKKSVVT